MFICVLRLYTDKRKTERRMTLDDNSVNGGVPPAAAWAGDYWHRVTPEHCLHSQSLRDTATAADARSVDTISSSYKRVGTDSIVFRQHCSLTHYQIATNRRTGTTDSLCSTRAEAWSKHVARYAARTLCHSGEKRLMKQVLWIDVGLLGTPLHFAGSLKSIVDHLWM